MSPSIPAHANPFRVQRTDRLRYRLGAVGWKDLLASAHRQRGGLLLGPHGSGKTTLLEELMPRLAAGGPLVWLRLRRDAAHNRAALADFFRVGCQGAAVAVDGLEQLSWWTWRRVRRHAAAARWLVATSHRAGRLPLLHRHTTDLDLLTDLVTELTAGSLRTADLGSLFRGCQGDLRACLRRCYDLAAAGGFMRS